MRRIPASLTLLLAALAAATALRAQSVHWQPPGGTLPVGEVSQLQLVFDDCTPDDTPTPPKVDGLTLEYLGSSNNISLINGSFTRSASLSFSVLLSKQQTVEIPAFSIDTNKGRLRVPAAHFSPAGATVGSSGVSISDAASAKMIPSSLSVWAGEVFDLNYSIDVDAGYYPTRGRGSFEWDPSPLVTEDWSQPEPYETRGGSPRTGLAYHTRAVAPSAGRVRLGPTSQLINLSVGVTGFGFFQQRQYQQFAVPDSPVTIDVRPLPAAPADFSGAVGDFKIASKIIPTRVKVGEPVTWTVELSGSGNWPQIRGLPAREAPADFQVIQPKPKRTQPAGKLFEGSLSEDIVLVPTQAGTYELPPLTFVYFDPRSGDYKSVVAPGATITADPAASATPAPSLPAAAAPGAPPASASAPSSETKAPELPAGSLGDPLPPSDAAPRLHSLRWVLGLGAVPFALVAGLWGVFAYLRARQTDPRRPKREAYRRIEATIEALGAAPSAGQAPLLLAWQHDSAFLWDIAHAAPPASNFPDADWSALWSEADRSLYGADKALPADWVARARAALAKQRPGSFQPLSLFHPRNLAPFFVLALCLAAPARGADSAAASYAKGDFPAAERSWLAQLEGAPLDWSARHNLSLALSQQDRWGEAAAHAAAAYVQQPQNPAVRHQLVTACDKAGFVPSPFDALLQPGPVQDLARRASPAAWQRAALAASALFALALGLALAAGYHRARAGWVLSLAGAAALASLVLGISAFVGFRAYGIAADTRAVVAWRAGILRSIPSEADNSQKTTPLAAGSTAVVDKTFLGWVHLSFTNGEAGWVSRTEVVYLWRSPKTD